MQVKIKRNSIVRSELHPEGKKRRGIAKTILLGKPLGNYLEK